MKKHIDDATGPELAQGCTDNHFKQEVSVDVARKSGVDEVHHPLSPKKFKIVGKSEAYWCSYCDAHPIHHVKNSSGGVMDVCQTHWDSMRSWNMANAPDLANRSGVDEGPVYCKIYKCNRSASTTTLAGPACKEHLPEVAAEAKAMSDRRKTKKNTRDVARRSGVDEGYNFPTSEHHKHDHSVCVNQKLQPKGLGMQCYGYTEGVKCRRKSTHWASSKETSIPLVPLCNTHIKLFNVDVASKSGVDEALVCVHADKSMCIGNINRGSGVDEVSDSEQHRRFDDRNKLIAKSSTYTKHDHNKCPLYLPGSDGRTMPCASFTCEEQPKHRVAMKSNQMSSAGYYHVCDKHLKQMLGKGPVDVVNRSGVDEARFLAHHAAKRSGVDESSTHKAEACMSGQCRIHSWSHDHDVCNDKIYSHVQCDLMDRCDPVNKIWKSAEHHIVVQNRNDKSDFDRFFACENHLKRLKGVNPVNRSGVDEGMTHDHRRCVGPFRSCFVCENAPGEHLVTSTSGRINRHLCSPCFKDYTKLIPTDGGSPVNVASKSGVDESRRLYDYHKNYLKLSHGDKCGRECGYVQATPELNTQCMFCNRKPRHARVDRTVSPLPDDGFIRVCDQHMHPPTKKSPVNVARRSGVDEGESAFNKRPFKRHTLGSQFCGGCLDLPQDVSCRDCGGKVRHRIDAGAYSSDLYLCHKCYANEKYVDAARRSGVDEALTHNHSQCVGPFKPCFYCEGKNPSTHIVRGANSERHLCDGCNSFYSKVTARGNMAVAINATRADGLSRSEKLRIKRGEAGKVVEMNDTENEPPTNYRLHGINVRNCSGCVRMPDRAKCVICKDPAKHRLAHHPITNKVNYDDDALVCHRCYRSYPNMATGVNVARKSGVDESVMRKIRGTHSRATHRGCLDGSKISWCDRCGDKNSFDTGMWHRFAHQGNVNYVCDPCYSDISGILSTPQERRVKATKKQVNKSGVDEAACLQGHLIDSDGRCRPCETFNQIAAPKYTHDLHCNDCHAVSGESCGFCGRGAKHVIRWSDKKTDGFQPVCDGCMLKNSKQGKCGWGKLCGDCAKKRQVRKSGVDEAMKVRPYRGASHVHNHSKCADALDGLDDDTCDDFHNGRRCSEFSKHIVLHHKMGALFLCDYHVKACKPDVANKSGVDESKKYKVPQHNWHHNHDEWCHNDLQRDYGDRPHCEDANCDTGNYASHSIQVPVKYKTGIKQEYTAFCDSCAARWEDRGARKLRKQVNKSGVDEDVKSIGDHFKYHDHKKCKASEEKCAFKCGRSAEHQPEDRFINGSTCSPCQRRLEDNIDQIERIKKGAYDSPKTQGKVVQFAKRKVEEAVLREAIDMWYHDHKKCSSYKTLTCEFCSTNKVAHKIGLSTGFAGTPLCHPCFNDFKKNGVPDFYREHDGSRTPMTDHSPDANYNDLPKSAVNVANKSGVDENRYDPAYQWVHDHDQCFLIGDQPLHGWCNKCGDKTKPKQDLHYVRRRTGKDGTIADDAAVCKKCIAGMVVDHARKSGVDEAHETDPNGDIHDHQRCSGNTDVSLCQLGGGKRYSPCAGELHTVRNPPLPGAHKKEPGEPTDKIRWDHRRTLGGRGDTFEQYCDTHLPEGVHNGMLRLKLWRKLKGTGTDDVKAKNRSGVDEAVKRPKTIKGYQAVIVAKEGVLVGGVKRHMSSAFCSLQGAQDFASTVLDGNKKAGRKAELKGIKEMDVDPERIIHQPTEKDGEKCRECGKLGYHRSRSGVDESKETEWWHNHPLCHTAHDLDPTRGANCNLTAACKSADQAPGKHWIDTKAVHPSHIANGEGLNVCDKCMDYVKKNGVPEYTGQIGDQMKAAGTLKHHRIIHTWGSVDHANKSGVDESDDKLDKDYYFTHDHRECDYVTSCSSCGKPGKHRVKMNGAKGYAKLCAGCFDNAREVLGAPVIGHESQIANRSGVDEAKKLPDVSLDGWSASTAKIDTRDHGVLEVPAYVHKSGAFVVHRHFNTIKNAKVSQHKDWTITHAPTGKTGFVSWQHHETPHSAIKQANKLVRHPEANHWTDGEFEVGKQPERAWLVKAERLCQETDAGDTRPAAIKKSGVDEIRARFAKAVINEGWGGGFKEKRKVDLGWNEEERTDYKYKVRSRKIGWQSDSLDHDASNGKVRLRHHGKNVHELHVGGDHHVLFSYDTAVATCNHKTKEQHETSKAWGPTTTGHKQTWFGHTHAKDRAHGSDPSKYTEHRKPQEHFDNMHGGLALKRHTPNAVTVLAGGGKTLFHKGVPIVHQDENGKVWRSQKTYNNNAKGTVGYLHNSSRQEFEFTPHHNLERIVSDHFSLTSGAGDMRDKVSKKSGVDEAVQYGSPENCAYEDDQRGLCVPGKIEPVSLPAHPSKKNRLHSYPEETRYVCPAHIGKARGHARNRWNSARADAPNAAKRSGVDEAQRPYVPPSSDPRASYWEHNDKHCATKKTILGEKGCAQVLTNCDWPKCSEIAQHEIKQWEPNKDKVSFSSHSSWLTCDKHTHLMVKTGYQKPADPVNRSGVDEAPVNLQFKHSQERCRKTGEQDDHHTIVKTGGLIARMEYCPHENVTKIPYIFGQNQHEPQHLRAIRQHITGHALRTGSKLVAGSVGNQNIRKTLKSKYRGTELDKKPGFVHGDMEFKLEGKDDQSSFPFNSRDAEVKRTPASDSGQYATQVDTKSKKFRKLAKTFKFVGDDENAKKQGSMKGNVMGESEECMFKNDGPYDNITIQCSGAVAGKIKNGAWRGASACQAHLDYSPLNNVRRSREKNKSGVDEGLKRNATPERSEAAQGHVRLESGGSNVHQLHVGRQKSICFSYNTPVAECDHRDGVMRHTTQQKWDDRLVSGGFQSHNGSTTKKHISQFSMAHQSCQYDSQSGWKKRQDVPQNYFDKHKDFGGKLHIEHHSANVKTLHTGHGKTLFSYGVPVAHHDTRTGETVSCAPTKSSKGHITKHFSHGAGTVVPSHELERKVGGTVISNFEYQQKRSGVDESLGKPSRGCSTSIGADNDNYQCACSSGTEFCTDCEAAKCPDSPTCRVVQWDAKTLKYQKSKYSMYAPKPVDVARKSGVDEAQTRKCICTILYDDVTAADTHCPPCQQAGCPQEHKRNKNYGCQSKTYGSHPMSSNTAADYAAKKSGVDE